MLLYQAITTIYLFDLFFKPFASFSRRFLKTYSYRKTAPPVSAAATAAATAAAAAAQKKKPEAKASGIDVLVES